LVDLFDMYDDARTGRL